MNITQDVGDIYFVFDLSLKLTRWIINKPDHTDQPFAAIPSQIFGRDSQAFFQRVEGKWV